MKLELAQIAIDDGTVDSNLGRVLSAIEQCQPDTDIVLLPEAALTGFPGRDRMRQVALTVDGPILDRVRVAARRKGVGVAVGLAERDGEQFFNTTVLFDAKGETRLLYRKTHLWPAEIDMFEPGDRFAVCRFNGVTVGILICYDIEFPETARAVAGLGAEVLLVTAANMDPFGPVHRRAIAARAMENQIFAAYVNRTGGASAHLKFLGESALIDPYGEVISDMGAAPGSLSGSLRIDALTEARQHYSYLRETRIGLELEHNAEPNPGQILLKKAR